jgi:hypothetical protein
MSRLDGCLRMTRLPATSVVVDSATLLATLFRGGFVVACALLPVRIVVVAVVVTLQAVGSVALGTGRSVWVFHDGELRTSQVVVARTRVLAVLLWVTVGAPRVAERNVLRPLVGL